VSPSFELVCVLALGATYSLTLLVTSDHITGGLRRRVLERLSGHGLVVPPSDVTAEGFAWVELVGAGLGKVRCRCGYEQLCDPSDDPDGTDEAERSVVSHVMTQQDTALDDDLRPSWRSKVAYLIRCPWCASAWVGVPVAVSAWLWGDHGWWLVTALVLTGRVVSGTWARYASPNGAD
jgi:hypothetical protein